MTSLPLSRAVCEELRYPQIRLTSAFLVSLRTHLPLSYSNLETSSSLLQWSIRKYFIAKWVRSVLWTRNLIFVRRWSCVRVRNVDWRSTWYVSFGDGPWCPLCLFPDETWRCWVWTLRRWVGKVGPARRWFWCDGFFCGCFGCRSLAV